MKLLQRLWLFPRAGVILAVLCASLVLPGAAIAYHIVTYYGTASIAWNIPRHSGYNTMQMNRVYRPTPKTFALWYEGGLQYDENRNTNPFVHDNPGGYTRAYCADVDPYVYTGTPNTTCQYKVLHT